MFRFASYKRFYNDGEAFHSSKVNIARDRNRNNELTRYSWSVLRFSGYEIDRDPEKCINKIKRTIKTLNGGGRVNSHFKT